MRVVEGVVEGYSGKLNFLIDQRETACVGRWVHGELIVLYKTVSRAQ